MTMNRRANVKPLLQSWNAYVNHVCTTSITITKYGVRKIAFSTSHDVNNPAPDPVLLLGKAASNWMKCQVLFLLPGCDISNDSGLDFVKLFREEMAMRGWFLCAGTIAS